MAGKGDSPRPLTVSVDEFDRRFEKTFADGRSNDTAGERAGSGTGEEAGTRTSTGVVQRAEGAAPSGASSPK